MLRLFVVCLSLSIVFAIYKLLVTWLDLICIGSPLGSALKIVSLYLGRFDMSRLLLSLFGLVLDRCVACFLSFGVYAAQFVPAMLVYSRPPYFLGP